jgi:Fibrobacter succinogenes major domain (Fib_succ_major).
MKFSPYLISFAVIFCILLLFSCSSNIELPPSPDSLFSSGDSSSSGGGGSSSSIGSSSSGGDDNVSSSSQTPPPPLYDNEFLDTRDNNKYKYEIYDGRVWMSENLRYSKDGTIGYCYKTGLDKEIRGIPGEEGDGCKSPYGRNYTYAETMDGNTTRGICPEGWHIPNVADWSNSMGNMSNSFYVLAGNFNTNSRWPPLGWKERDLTTSSDNRGYYWANSSNFRFFLMMPGQNSRVDENSASVDDYFSVRCIMDEGGELPCGSSSYNPVTELCVNGTKYPKMCGDKTWDPGLQQCNGGVLTCLPILPTGYSCFGNEVYQVTTVNGQTWMASNLNRGATYDWATAMNLASACNSSSTCVVQDPHQGICPTGWHIPKRDEITSNTFFSSGIWWTATQSSGYDAYYKSISGNIYFDDKAARYPVRCVKND